MPVYPGALGVDRRPKLFFEKYSLGRHSNTWTPLNTAAQTRVDARH